MKAKRTYNESADTVLREFPEIGHNRVRHMETARGVVLDIREYLSTERFDGFTRKGIRLSMSEAAQLAAVLAEILDGAQTSPQIDAEPVAQPETPAPVATRAQSIVESLNADPNASRVDDYLKDGPSPAPKPSPARETRRIPGKALTPAEYAARLLGK